MNLALISCFLLYILHIQLYFQSMLTQFITNLVKKKKEHIILILE